MSWYVEWVVILGLFMAFLIPGLWIPFALALAGIAGVFIHGGPQALVNIGNAIWAGVESYPLAAGPLFIIMAEVLLTSGISNRFYTGLSVLLRKLPGNLLQVNVLTCMFFAALIGSSMVCAITVGTVAIPEMKSRGFDQRMTYGSLAAGGTLGILIPPSLAMIIFGVLAEQSIPKLFMAGLIPGIMLGLMFMIYIAIRVKFQPHLAPPTVEGRVPWQAIVKSVMNLLPMLFVILITLLGIYLGWLTATEAAAIGLTLSILVAIGVCKIKWGKLAEAIWKGTETSGMVMYFIASAYIFSYAIQSAGLGRRLAEWVVLQGFSPGTFLVAIVLLYLVLGLFIDSLAIIVVTTATIFPIAVTMGINPIWYGIMTVILVELGQVTPPYGVNLFAIQMIAGRPPIGEIIRGAAPYFPIYILLLILLYAVPQISLWLPSTMR